MLQSVSTSTSTVEPLIEMVVRGILLPLLTVNGVSRWIGPLQLKLSPKLDAEVTVLTCLVPRLV